MKTLRCFIAVVAMLLVCTTAKAQTVIKADSATVAQWMERAAAGEAVAQNKVGLWYYTGVGGLEKDYVIAAKYWALAAKQDNSDAIGNLAMCYQLGNGVEADSTTAAKLYINAIQKGNTKLLDQHERLAAKGKIFSIMLLYDIYNNGKAGQTRDQTRGLSYLTKAAESDHDQAQMMLALTYMNSKKYDEALKWFRKLAEKDNATGIYYCGYLLYNGMGVEQDLPTAIAYLEKAASTGFVNADRLLGQIYYKGEGTAKDLIKAITHLKIAAQGGKTDAQLLLGQCYMSGEGVTSDYDIAAYWLGEAFANHLTDDVTAYINSKELFKTYLKGLKAYYAQDFSTATDLFDAVGKTGRNEGLVMKARCMADPANKKGNAKKAFKLMNETAENCLMAKYFLADMYEQGIGTKKDATKAQQLRDEVQGSPDWNLPYDPAVQPKNVIEMLNTL